MIDSRHLSTAPTSAPIPDLPTATAAPHRTSSQANALLEEIHVLRARGLSDECIHGLLSGFNIDARPEPATGHWKMALNDQLIALIWGKSAPAHVGAD